MADGFIVRKGGVTTEQALAPTITEVSTTQTSITFTITNNDASTAVILYEVDDATPDANSIELAAAATSGNLTISGLSPGTVDLYATANVTGKVKSNVTEREFTLVSPFTAATGGTTLEYDSGGKRFRSHTFLDSGTFTVSNVGDAIDDRNKVDYLIIAGGGGGGFGGGGAGGYKTTNGISGGDSSAESKVVVTAQAHTITVGLGGAAETNGQNTSALGQTANGGGTGGTAAAGAAGGSGGGGGTSSGSGTYAGGTGISGQGRDGGTGNRNALSAGRGGGGGGGAFAVGGNGVGGVGGGGGNGLSNTLRTSSAETRGGGGGGITQGTESISSGGTGGGGAGGRFNSFTGGTNVNGVSGTANTGGGGGSAGADGASSAASGGKGIVIIRYEIAPSV